MQSGASQPRSQSGIGEKQFTGVPPSFVLQVRAKLFIIMVHQAIMRASSDNRISIREQRSTCAFLTPAHQTLSH